MRWIEGALVWSSGGEDMVGEGEWWSLMMEGRGERRGVRE